MQSIQTSYTLTRFSRSLRVTSTAFWIFIVNFFPFCDFIAKWTIVLILLCFNVPKSLVLFYFMFLSGFLHHKLSNTTSFKASLTFSIFCTAQINLIRYLFTFWARNAHHNRFETRTVRSRAFLYYLVIQTDIFKVILFINHNMLIFNCLSSLYICNPVG